MTQKRNKPKLTNVKPLEMPSNPHTKGDVCAPCLHFLAICLTLWMLHKVKNLMGQDRFTVGCNMCLPWPVECTQAYVYFYIAVGLFTNNISKLMSERFSMSLSYTSKHS